MPFTVVFMDDAKRQVRELRAYDRTRVLDEIESQLTHQADQESRNRKQLFEHPIASWELRVGDRRAFYDIEYDAESKEERAVIVAIGRKVRQGVIIDGEEIEL